MEKEQTSCGCTKNKYCWKCYEMAIRHAKDEGYSMGYEAGINYKEER